ncbi:TIM-barrel domain-containing protein [Streptomyces sp. AM 2-1-1]|uniref:TIM-barrel domain-containing protein n=1 Tax=Streptomyces sp. AM 2-1-1 TaxID=3028709 RepID=UPI0023B9460B|nr:TIM-barrel domain-containing protein [Streptomyces sp. AM 2-1-1]WEH43751.1 glycoside hydrolase family 31 protein [Streptomyces sp. AM 2-1-1]
MSRGGSPRRARRRVGAVAALAVAASTTLTGTATATATESHGARIPTVTSGNARFEILSPTLVRTEYAGDGAFTDAPTFNAIGRDGFTPTAYTARTEDGWLTVRTSAMTLRYRVGSGPFDAENLSVRLDAGERPVTAAPWQRLVCALGALCEAEDLRLEGLGTASDHRDHTGAAFAAGFEATGSSVAADIDVKAAGSYRFALKYANSTGGDGKTETRTLSLSVDGGAPRKVELPATANWDTWAEATAQVELGAGQHTVALTRTAADSGSVNLDSVALLRADDDTYPSATTTAIKDCRFGTSCEAESARIAGTATGALDHPGYAGHGFVAELNQHASLTTHLVGVPADGVYTLRVRYANGQGGDGLHRTRTASVTSTGTDVTSGGRDLTSTGPDVTSAGPDSAPGSTATLELPATKDWNDWQEAAVPVSLRAGANDITLGCPDPASCHVNADTLSVASPESAAPQPHLALGGYRRGLDGVSGQGNDPVTTPGLLSRDGWYLLDDTPSALYDPESKKVRPRPARGGAPYQDGYLFGYGHDYKRGLTDLATLTGPPALLPTWAYGVWYSEYIDRTAADYQDEILPAFRAEGVPLDVLVTDTDFKAGDTWRGWEIDPAKFPDAKGFFDWSEAQGLHNTLNTHPSIQGSDPQFARAQATARGKLVKGGCRADCYVFDFGDADQLRAYMDLHRTMDEQGVDFWWLDWCCDASQSSLAGVTPDAWINQQYADDSARAVGRGFVLSRAYGSLQAGGYSGQQALPTGPWADKRSTVHFTGDTASTWGTLRFEVGYTPGESAATGMASITHDIGGHNDTTGLPGAEEGTHKLPDDLYARWVQFGTFQPVDRLHSNHSDRLPWQYGPAARKSADAFLNLRENLVPYTYTLAEEANRTGVPIVRPAYLEYPEEQAAYAAAGSEYFYGSDVLVAPVTTPGESATTPVWFPPGRWTDYFTGATYTGGEGGTTRDVTTTLDTMPVFIRSGGIMPTRSENVTDNARNPLTDVTLSVAAGASGSYTLYEDDGTTATGKVRSATTAVSYREKGSLRTVTVAGTKGSYDGQVKNRRWTLSLLGTTHAPTEVTARGKRLARDAYTWDEATGVLTVTLPKQSVRTPAVVTVR